MRLRSGALRVKLEHAKRKLHFIEGPLNIGAVLPGDSGTDCSLLSGAKRGAKHGLVSLGLGSGD